VEERTCPCPTEPVSVGFLKQVPDSCPICWMTGPPCWWVSRCPDSPSGAPQHRQVGLCSRMVVAVGMTVVHVGEHRSSVIVAQPGLEDWEKHLFLLREVHLHDMV
jgi:hypothetical protein